jgi:prolyl 4-hydroxylase
VAEQVLTRVRVTPPRGDGPGYPRLTPVASAPRVYVQDGFATDAECDHLLAFAADRAELAALGIPVKADSTGFSFEYPLAVDPVATALADRIETTLGVRNALGGTLRFRLYGPGEAHPPHVDTFRIGDLDLVATAIVALTDVAAGGATAFPHAVPPLAVRPRRGRLLAWLNNCPDGSPDPLSFHEGQAVESGEKGTITLFAYADPRDCALLREGPAALRPPGSGA